MNPLLRLYKVYGPYKTREMLARTAIILAGAFLFLFNIDSVWTDGVDALWTFGNFAAVGVIAAANGYLLRLWTKHGDSGKVRKWMVKAVPLLAGAAALAAYYFWILEDYAG